MKENEKIPTFVLVVTLKQGRSPGGETLWGTLVIYTNLPSGYDVFKIYDWGIWCIYEKTQHWITWTAISEIRFGKNPMLTMKEDS